MDFQLIEFNTMDIKWIGSEQNWIGSRKL